MGTSALPDMHARRLMAAGPRTEGKHIRKRTSAYVITDMLHFRQSKNLPKSQVHHLKLLK